MDTCERKYEVSVTIARFSTPNIHVIIKRCYFENLELVKGEIVMTQKVYSEVWDLDVFFKGGSESQELRDTFG